MDITYGAPLQIQEIKASDGGGWEVAGYASTFGNVDHGGDVVMRAAFDQTLADWKSGKGKIRFLFGHDTWQVLGVPKELRADDKGLFGTFKISKTQLGEDVHTLLKDAALDSFSIGYVPTEVEFDDVGTRLLKQIDLLEVSVVAIPMNDLATVTRVKADLPFDKMFARSGEHLKLAATEAKALVERRASEKRELTERQLAAIKELIPEAEAWTEQLRALLPTPPLEELGGDLKLRLELARRLSMRRGHLVEVA